MARLPSERLRPQPLALLAAGLFSLATLGFERDPSLYAPAVPLATDAGPTVLNAGLLSLQITDFGVIGNPWSEEVSAGWRGGEYLYSSGLWVAALGADRERHVSTAAYDHNQNNRHLIEFRSPAGPAWKVYRSFEGAPGGRRPNPVDPAAADDDGDLLVDEDFLDGFDNDGDGRVDEDYAAVGQQMLTVSYRDDTAEALTQLPDHTPLGLLVRQRVFQWSSPGIQEFAGLEWTVINDGDQRLQDVHLGLFVDADAGVKRPGLAYFEDDLAGWGTVDTVVTDPAEPAFCASRGIRFDYAAVWDAPDDGSGAAGGDVPGVFGTAIFGHTRDLFGVTAPATVGFRSLYWFGGTAGTPVPRNDPERYELLAGDRRGPERIRTPANMRFLMTVGPFPLLDPGESVTVEAVYAVGEGESGLRTGLVNARRVYDGRWIDADRDPATGAAGRETCLRVLDPGDELVWTDPCDSMATPVLWNRTSCLWVDADCNPCTGNGGREFRLHWIGTTAPPPPLVNTAAGAAADPPAGDQTVRLDWDNASELVDDPITGEAIFEGYRVWKADTWQRPSGSLGPAPEDWKLIGEFRLHPPDGLGLTSPNHLRRVTRIEVAPTGATPDGRNIYPVGRYRFTDVRGVVNGIVHFYSVTPLGLTTRIDPDSGEEVEVLLETLPAAVEAEAVVPRWDAASGCDAIAVVPNPYRGRAGWDLIPSGRDPTGSRIAFRGLPAEPSTIRIYTLSGDLVVEADHDGRGGNGTYFWNLLSRNGQRVVSGIYLYAVVTRNGTCRGRLVVIL